MAWYLYFGITLNSHKNKYFITILAVLLVFSNFSIAAANMLCTIQSDNACTCSEHKVDGPAVRSQNSCCQVNVYEIRNENLSNIVSQKFKLINSLSAFTSFNTELTFSYENKFMVYSVFNPPREDIHLQNLTLLI